MPNANLELIWLKREGRLLNLYLKVTPLYFLLKYAPWLASKICMLYPTERIIEYPFIHENIPFGGRGKILDVGSKATLLPFELASKGWKVWAIDLKRGYSKILSHVNFTCVQGDIRKTNFPDAFFDIVTAISSIEHVGLGSRKIDLNGDKKALQEIVRILKPRGTLLITVPFGERGGLYPSKNHPSWRVYNSSTLSELLSSLETQTKKFALLDNNMSWRPSSLEEVEHIDSLNQSRWVASKAVALVVARKKEFEIK